MVKRKPCSRTFLRDIGLLHADGSQFEIHEGEVGKGVGFPILQSPVFQVAPYLSVWESGRPSCGIVSAEFRASFYMELSIEFA